MLKRVSKQRLYIRFSQPPSGGCVLKHRSGETVTHCQTQPPSGGCVLKLLTQHPRLIDSNVQPPSGGCVLKLCMSFHTAPQFGQPPSGGCVLKPTA